MKVEFQTSGLEEIAIRAVAKADGKRLSEWVEGLVKSHVAVILDINDIKIQ
jgi:hypothetical protein